ncbi:MAG: signal peptidase I [Dehalobacter sp.]|nr:signal peptidase I [Dehalobacter sp.]
MIDTIENTPQDKTIVVVGNSMSPTLQALDVVTISTNTRDICPGDIIVFPSPKNAQKVIHRVTSITAQGIMTRGDNSIFIDTWTVNPGDVIGKVGYARRGGRRLHIYNGIVGQLIAWTLFVVNFILYYAKRLIYRINRAFSLSGIIKACLPKIMKPEVLSFKRPEGVELQLIMGRTIIGQYHPSTDRWIIKTPYRLFIDEEYLEKIRLSCKAPPTEASSCREK